MTIYYSFLSGLMFYGFLHALVQTKWSAVFIHGLLCIMWLLNAFVEKEREELKQDD